MNLAIIIEKFGATGGAERMAGYVVAGLRDRGHEVHVYASAFEGPAEAVCVPHRISARGLLSNRHVAFAKSARKAVGRHDVVYSFTRTVSQDVLRLGGGIHAEYLLRMERARSAIGRAFSRINPKERSILALEKLGLETTRKIVAVSRRVKEEAVEHYGVDPKKVAVLHNAVDLSRFTPALKAGRREWLAAAGVPDDGVIALFAGSGFRRKGLPTAIEAVAKLPGTRLVVCGKDDAADAKALARKLKAASRVHFLGSRKDIERAYGACDALLLPALYDPFPNVVLEAMACGTPAIVSEVCGPSEIISDGEDSFIEEEADGIVSSLQILKDPGERRRIGEAARAAAERHPIEAYVDETAELLENAV